MLVNYAQNEKLTQRHRAAISNALLFSAFHESNYEAVLIQPESFWRLVFAAPHLVEWEKTKIWQLYGRSPKDDPAGS